MDAKGLHILVMVNTTRLHMAGLDVMKGDANANQGLSLQVGIE